jgi:hypothetical protein
MRVELFGLPAHLGFDVFSVLDETVRLRIKADRPRRRALEAVDVNLDRPPPADLRHRLHGAELVVGDAAALDLAGLGIANLHLALSQ